MPSVLVTGATAGLGRQLAEDLAGRGWTVLAHGRDESKLADVPGEPYVADLSSFDEVRRLAREVQERNERLDVLVNNAGIIGERRELSADGHELTFAVNYLAGFLLTLELVPLLRASAPARVVNVSSIGQRAIDFSDPMLERGWDGYGAYAQSKLAQIMFTFELADRLHPDEITVNALHPATLMDTQMVRGAFGHARSTVRQGADATLRLIEDPELDGVSGRYFNGSEDWRADAQAYDADARRRLWELSEDLTGARL